jgi:DNA-binding NarL/FixJ family response regulator
MSTLLSLTRLSYLNTEPHRRAAAPRTADGVPAPDKLSRREREVLALLALGHRNGIHGLVAGPERDNED